MQNHIIDINITTLKQERSFTWYKLIVKLDKKVVDVQIVSIYSDSININDIYNHIDKRYIPKINNHLNINFSEMSIIDKMHVQYKISIYNEIEIGKYLSKEILKKFQYQTYNNIYYSYIYNYTGNNRISISNNDSECKVIELYTLFKHFQIDTTITNIDNKVYEVCINKCSNPEFFPDINSIFKYKERDEVKEYRFDNTLISYDFMIENLNNRNIVKHLNDVYSSKILSSEFNKKRFKDVVENIINDGINHYEYIRETLYNLFTYMNSVYTEVFNYSNYIEHLIDITAAYERDSN